MCKLLNLRRYCTKSTRLGGFFLTSPNILGKFGSAFAEENVHVRTITALPADNRYND